MASRADVAAAAARFGVVGAACAVLNVAIVWVGNDLLGAHYVAATLATCLITIPLAYAAHRRFSFALASPAGWAEFMRFAGQQLSQFVLGLVLLVAGVEVLGLPPVAAMALVSLLMFAYGFFTNARWVFRAFGRR
jgi:putative flippase GtrA